MDDDYEAYHSLFLSLLGKSREVASAGSAQRPKDAWKWGDGKNLATDLIVPTPLGEGLPWSRGQVMYISEIST